MNSLLARLTSHVRRMQVAYLVLVISLIPAVLFYFRVTRNVEAKGQVQFDRFVEDSKADIGRQFSAYVDQLWALRALFDSSSPIDQSDWRKYFQSLDLKDRRQGMLAMGYVEKVTTAGRQAFLDRQRAQGHSDFQITPPGDRAQYFPIVFLENLQDGPLGGFGLDHFAEPERRAAMEQARDINAAYATGKTQFLNPGGQPDKDAGLIIYLPVYKPGQPLSSAPQRRAALQGFVFAVLAPAQMFQEVLAPATSTVITLKVYDGSTPGPGQLLFDNSGKLPPRAGPLFDATVPIPLAELNRTLNLHFQSLPQFESEGQAVLGPLTLVAGLAISFFFFGVTAFQIRARERAEHGAAVLKKSETALAQEKERLDVTLQSIAEGVITIDPSGKVASINRAGERLTGWTQAEAANKPLGEIFRVLDEKTRQPAPSPAQSILDNGPASNLESPVVLVARNGAERIIASSAAPIHDTAGRPGGVVLVFRDVTERQKSEAEMLKESKLESVGLLAGGIAHDFNNILQGIIGNVSLARMTSHSTEKILERLNGVEKAAQRAKDLTHQLLTFARGGAPIKRTAQLCEIVRDATQFALRGTNVDCEFSLASDPWPVEVDEGQFRQVINNLVINATQAMPEGGRIDVRCENVELTAGYLPPLAAGKHVKVSIRDHGPGIKPEHLPRIFDPYFTTKKHGSGLGLASAYSVIRKHDGQIRVESAAGAGTTFQIYLPASVKAPPAVAAEDDQTRFFGQGRILIMDDEEDIRMVLSEMLKIVGYEVEATREGGEAIEAYQNAKKSGRPFDAVIIDLTIPNGMGGKEAVRRLRELDPNVKALVSSGYSFDPVMANFKEFGFCGVIPKPYVIEQLGRVLGEVLGSNNGNGKGAGNGNGSPGQSPGHLNLTP